MAKLNNMFRRPMEQLWSKGLHTFPYCEPASRIKILSRRQPFSPEGDFICGGWVFISGSVFPCKIQNFVGTFKQNQRAYKQNVHLNSKSKRKKWLYECVCVWCVLSKLFEYEYPMQQPFYLNDKADWWCMLRTFIQAFERDIRKTKVWMKEGHTSCDAMEWTQLNG